MGIINLIQLELGKWVSKVEFLIKLNILTDVLSILDSNILIASINLVSYCDS